MPVGLSGAGMHPGVQLTPHHSAVTSWTCLLAVGAGPLAPRQWLSSGRAAEMQWGRMQGGLQATLL